MLRLRYIAVCAALMAQSISFSKVASAQFSMEPFSPQILPCSYGDGSQCGFGQEDEPERSQERPRSNKNRTFYVEPFVPSLESVSSSSTANFNGKFAGKYTMSVLFSPSSKGIMQLQQSGNQVTGILTTKTGRRADVFGVVRGGQLIGKWIFTDECSGQGSMIAELSPAGDFLIGKYRASDCVGKYSGKYKLLKQ